MKKVIFKITLIFIIGLPFSSQALKSVYPQKATYSVKEFSKKQKKKNFFQRIILKKIQRKIDRQIKKRNKLKKNNQSTKAKTSLILAVGAILTILIGFSVISTATTLGAFFSGIILFGILVILFSVGAIISGLNYFEEKNSSNQKNNDDVKARFGIVIGSIILVISFLLFAAF